MVIIIIVTMMIMMMIIMKIRRVQKRKIVKNVEMKTKEKT